MSQPAIQQWAGHYRNLGLGVVPLLPRTKRCIVDDWSTRIFDVKDFAPDANIGLRSIDGVVVVDDDFKTNDAVAIACMNHFLPPCGAVYGRPKSPRCKRLYWCSLATVHPCLAANALAFAIWRLTDLASSATCCSLDRRA